MFGSSLRPTFFRLHPPPSHPVAASDESRRSGPPPAGSRTPCPVQGRPGRPGRKSPQIVPSPLPARGAAPCNRAARAPLLFLLGPRRLRGTRAPRPTATPPYPSPGQSGAARKSDADLVAAKGSPSLSEGGQAQHEALQQSVPKPAVTWTDRLSDCLVIRALSLELSNGIGRYVPKLV